LAARAPQLSSAIETSSTNIYRVRVCLSSLHDPDTTTAMASLMRPSVLRQAPAASQRITAAFVRPSAAMAQLRPAFQNSTRVAAFHATQRNQILPPLPQKIIGTANVHTTAALRLDISDT